MATSAVSNRERAGCLSYWLAILVLLNVVGIVSYLTGGNSVFYLPPNPPTWAIGLLIGATVVSAVCAYGVWMWKRWGLYGFVASFIVAMIAHVIIGGNPIAALFTILGLFMLYAMLRGRIGWFE